MFNQSTWYCSWIHYHVIYIVTLGNISNTLKTISDESSSNLSCDLLLTDCRHDDTSNTNRDGHSAVEKSNEWVFDNTAKSAINSALNYKYNNNHYSN